MEPVQGRLGITSNVTPRVANRGRTATLSVGPLGAQTLDFVQLRFSREDKDLGLRRQLSVTPET